MPTGMKRLIKDRSLGFLVFGLALIMIAGCKKEEDTIPNKTVSDVEGNIYPIVDIGTQTWMGENLKTTKFNDGADIALVINDAEWSNLDTPGYCWYENDKTNYGDTYGALYNWYAVNTGKLCPAGWHVPTDAEWTILTDYLGGENMAGDKIKETGMAHWIRLNLTATNETGFTALPNGFRFPFEYTFSDIGFTANWWSSDFLAQDDKFAWYRELGNEFRRDGFLKEFGLGVRCLRD